MLFGACVFLVVLAIIALIFHRFCNNSSSLLKQGIPSLKPLFLIGHIHYFVTKIRHHIPFRSATFHWLEAMAKLFDDSGWFYVTSLNRQVLVLHNADKAEAFLKTNLALDKASFYDPFDAALGNGILTSRVEKWKQRRKLLNPLFHEKTLEVYQPVFYKHASRFVEKLNVSDEKTRVDISCILEEILFDVILESTVGATYTTTRHRPKPVAKTLLQGIESVADGMFFSMIPDFVFNLLPLSKRIRSDIKDATDTINELWDFNLLLEKQRLLQQAEDNGHSFYVGLKDRLKEKNFQFSSRDFIDEFTSIIGGGFDSTKCTLEWLFLLIGQDERVQNKIHRELDEIFEGDKETEIITEHLNQMNYLSCVIKESMRLFAPAPIIGRLLTNDILLDGYQIPKGTDVFLLISAIHRNKKYFDEPDKFIPERFLPENVVGRHPYAYIPFSAGARNCIGNRFGKKNIKTIVANVLRRYKITSTEAIDKYYMDTTIFASPDKPVIMNFEKRTKG